MKILHGTLTETRYEYPLGEVGAPMRTVRERALARESVAYMADDLGVHRIENRGTDFAVSLHRKKSTTGLVK
jgi:cysteine dioxygenase